MIRVDDGATDTPAETATDALDAPLPGDVADAGLDGGIDVAGEIAAEIVVSPPDGAVAMDAMGDAAALDASSERAEPSYGLDRSREIVIEGIGTAPIEVGRSEYRQAACATGFFNALAQLEWRAPAERNSVTDARLLCHRLQPDGSTVGPTSESPPHVLAAAASVCGATVDGEPTRDTCPAGFVLVGLQGDVTLHASAGYDFASRLAPVCARLSAWVAHTDPAPARTSAFFQSAVAPGSDAGASDAAVDAGDAGSSLSSASFQRFYSCEDPVPTSALACSFAFRSGNQPAAFDNRNPRGFFRVCPGGFVPVSYRAMSGCLIDSLELTCVALVRR